MPANTICVTRGTKWGNPFKVGERLEGGGIVTPTMAVALYGAYLRQRPELAMRAVEETMRHSPIACGTLRLVVEDAELDGYSFPAGTAVLVNTFAANRDPAVYEDADRVDITREEAPPILTFGGGVHYCLGANLARREIAEALKVLANRLRTPRTAGPAPWKPMVSLSGPTSLPIEFDR